MAVDPGADMTSAALDCEGNVLLCDDWGCQQARTGWPCKFRMSPSERAKALGWVRDLHWWSWAGRTVVGSRRFRWYVPVADNLPPAEFGTEDEALEHALLLRDVWLS